MYARLLYTFPRNERAEKQTLPPPTLVQIHGSLRCLSIKEQPTMFHGAVPLFLFRYDFPRVSLHCRLVCLYYFRVQDEWKRHSATVGSVNANAALVVADTN